MRTTAVGVVRLIQVFVLVGSCAAFGWLLPRLGSAVLAVSERTGSNAIVEHDGASPIEPQQRVVTNPREAEIRARLIELAGPPDTGQSDQGNVTTLSAEQRQLIAELQVLQASSQTRGNNGATSLPPPSCPPVITANLGVAGGNVSHISGTSSQRLNRNGVQSLCGVPRSQPAPIAATRTYDQYTFTNNTAGTLCITITLVVLEQTQSNYIVGAFSAFNPNDLTSGWLGDPGLSTGIPPSTLSFSINVAAGANYDVLVMNTNSTGDGGAYSLTLLYPGCDPVPPTITCPADIKVATTDNSAVVNYPAPTASDNLGLASTVCTPPSGSTFFVGSTTVTCTATDTSNNTASCAFKVDVNRVAYSVTDPLQCTGQGSAVTGTFSMTNSGGAATSASATVTLPPGLVGVPGSCVTNFGSCVVQPSSVVVDVPSLPAGQTLTVTYKAQVGDQVATGTSLCTVLAASFGGGPAINVQACVTVNCPNSIPGLPLGGLTEVSDQKAGSVLFYNIYTSSVASPGSQNTRFSITNIEPTRRVAVHLFFVDGSTCSVSDRYVCLTPSQTMTFLASEQDPGTTGYLIAVAVDSLLGCPINFNYLIGEGSVKFSTGHAANLAAESVSAIAGGLSLCNANSVTGILSFDGQIYSRVGAVLASSGIGSRADGNDTLVVINRLGGDLLTSAGTLGTLFGILYDDGESSHSFQVSGGCQLRLLLSNATPRTTPRFETVIPAGTTGWLKVFSPSGLAMLGAQINLNPNSAISAGAFSQGHNLHKLRLAPAGAYAIPIFGPGC